MMEKMIKKLPKKIKKNAPEILTTFGILGFIGAGVLACFQTLKVPEVVEEHKELKSKIDKNNKKDICKVYLVTGLRFAELYGPSVIMGTLSAASILSSTRILKEKNASLAAAYATLDAGYKAYRKRVKERYGEETDIELRHGIKSEKVKEVIKNDDGSEEVVERTEYRVDDDIDIPYQPSEYSVFFDETSAFWEKDPTYNKSFLVKRQAIANEMLAANGWLYLNDVYDLLGIPRTTAGQVVGWIYDPSNKEIDNCVSFGIFDLHNPQKRKFVNGFERSILLDFNVDGEIWSKLHKKEKNK